MQYLFSIFCTVRKRHLSLQSAIRTIRTTNSKVEPKATISDVSTFENSRIPRHTENSKSFRAAATSTKLKFSRVLSLGNVPKNMLENI